MRTGSACYMVKRLAVVGYFVEWAYLSRARSPHLAELAYLYCVWSPHSVEWVSSTRPSGRLAPSSSIPCSSEWGSCICTTRPSGMRCSPKTSTQSGELCPFESLGNLLPRPNLKFESRLHCLFSHATLLPFRTSLNKHGYASLHISCHSSREVVIVLPNASNGSVVWCGASIGASRELIFCAESRVNNMYDKWYPLVIITTERWV